MLRLGEETGQLPMLAGRVGEFYEAKLQRSLDRVVGVAGPVAIIIISIVVGGPDRLGNDRASFGQPDRRMSSGRHDMIVGGRATRRRRSRGGEAGFTLIEILVVITIIGLIMGLVGPRVLNYLGESMVKAAKIQIESFASALDLFYLDAGRYPSSSEGLAALVQRPGGAQSWNGPYLKGAVVPNDPWGRAYLYRSPGEHGAYDIVSYGSDGQEGGEGTASDVTSWSH